MPLSGVSGFALSPPGPSVPRACSHGPLFFLLGGGGPQAEVARHRPHSAHFCELTLRALGAAGGCRVGGWRVMPV